MCDPFIGQRPEHVAGANRGVLAAYNVMKRYAVDPQRVFVSGFSGGARVAMRLALAYPDLFRGALMDAGSDPIGDAIPHCRRATCSSGSAPRPGLFT